MSRPPRNVNETERVKEWSFKKELTWSDIGDGKYAENVNASLGGFTAKIEKYLEEGNVDLALEVLNRMIMDDNERYVSVYKLFLKNYMERNDEDGLLNIIESARVDNMLIDTECYELLVHFFAGREDSNILDLLVEKGVTSDILLHENIFRYYVEREDAGSALHVFYSMRDYHAYPDLMMYTTMISLLLKKDMIDDVISALKQMKTDMITPNTDFYSSMIELFLSKDKLKSVYMILETMFDVDLHPSEELLSKIVRHKSYIPIVNQKPDEHFYYASLVNQHLKKSELGKAMNVVLTMKAEKIELGIVYSLLIDYFLQNNKTEEAMIVWDKMREDRVNPDSTIYTLVIAYYFKRGHAEDGISNYKMMKKEGIEPTIDTYGLVINHYLDIKDIDRALLVWEEVVSKGNNPDLLCHISIIEYYLEKENLERAHYYWRLITSSGSSDTNTLNTVYVERYFNTESTHKVRFHEMTKKNSTDFVVQDISVQDITDVNNFKYEKIYVLKHMNERSFADVLIILNETKDTTQITKITSQLTSVFRSVLRKNEVEAESLLQLMKKCRIKPLVDHYLVFLKHYLATRNSHQIGYYWEQIRKLNVPVDVYTYADVMHSFLYSKKNSYKIHSIYKEILEREITPTLSIYHVMIKLYHISEQYADAQAIYDKLLNQGIQPAYHTYFLMISLYSTTNMNKAGNLFDEMLTKGITPDYKICSIILNGYIDHFKGSPDTEAIDKAMSVCQFLIEKGKLKTKTEQKINEVLDLVNTIKESQQNAENNYLQKLNFLEFPS